MVIRFDIIPMIGTNGSNYLSKFAQIRSLHNKIRPNGPKTSIMVQTIEKWVNISKLFL